MKHYKIILLLTLFISLTTKVAFSQSTSLVIDNQTPGWLSSKINYGDQLSVERLKVTGYINGTDYIFLSKLIEHNLKALDLEDVNIVEGGDPIDSYTTSWGEVRNSYISTNVFGQYFGNYNYKNLQWLATPKSAFLYLKDFNTVYNDTLIVNSANQEIGSNTNPFYIYNRNNKKKYVNKYLVIGEGVKKINFSHILYYGGTYYHYVYTDGTIILPSTIEYIKGLVMSGGTLISYIQNPENVICEQETTSSGTDNCKLMPSVLWVPEGTKQSYMESSIFNNAINIFEMAPPENLELNSHNLKLYIGESSSLQVSMIPENAFYSELGWDTSDATVASVSESGEVTAINPGTANITVFSVRNPEIYTVCNVNVFEHAIGVSMSSTETTINVGETRTLSANTLPLGTSDNEISWSSSDPATASVDDLGNVTALRTGTCIIKATSVDGNYTAECTVTVVQPATNVTLNKHETTIIVNNNEALTAAIIPDNTTNKEIIWTSNNTEVADVNNNGIVMAKKAGSAKIYATALSNPEAKDSCNVTVMQPATGITLEETSWTIGELGVTKQLVARVLPEDASNKSVLWTSSNNSVCTVSSSGVVTSSGYGNAIVIATTTDGGYVATCTVTVYQPVKITATNCSRAYGEENPVFQYTSEGGTLNGTPEISCEATKTSPVGTYPIVISKGSVTNLGDTYVNGTLTITPAPLTISAGNYTKRQGEENPQFTASYEGFKNDESNDVLTKQPTITTSVTKETAPGEYPVVISGAEAQNYSISFINGVLKVLEADAIIIKADNKTISYGDAIPELTYTVEGAELQGTPSITCDATSRSSVGTYPIIISKGSVANYNDTYVNGILTIEKAPLTVSVGDYTRYQGEENPIFNLTYDGFRNGDGLSSLITIPQASTEATKDSPEGAYDIIISGGDAVNYYFKYVNGTLTILPTSSGIGSVYENMNIDDVTIYAPNGTRRSTLQRGINIIKMSDGTTRKVIVK